MSQRQAYIDAYPKAKEWANVTIDNRACELAKKSEVLVRCAEIRQEIADEIKQEARWTREKAYKTLTDLILQAETERATKQELTSPIVSAIINATKELNAIYAVGEDTEGQGVLEDILTAVRGINND